MEEYLEEEPAGVWWAPFTDEVRAQMEADAGKGILAYTYDDASFQRVALIADAFDRGYWEMLGEEPPIPPSSTPPKKR